MDVHDLTQHLRGVLATLTRALCVRDVRALEAATREAQRVLSDARVVQGQVDPNTAQQLQSLLETARGVVWAQLLSLWARGAQSRNALLQEAA